MLTLKVNAVILVFIIAAKCKHGSVNSKGSNNVCKHLPGALTLTGATWHSLAIATKGTA